MSGTLITAEVDYAAHGKQIGVLRVPHSVNRSAYGWIPAPVVVIANDEGPTVLMLAGRQGDEFEGQIAITKMVRELDPEDVRGRIIILTMANFPAAQAGLRVSPIDHGNLNRCFPGNARGTPTEMIAHYIEEVLMPIADHAVGLRSGGTSLIYPPTLLRGRGCTAEEAARLETLQAVFDLPYAWVFTSGGGPASIARMAMGAGNRKGVVSIMAEVGNGGTVSPDVLRRTERGLRRILHSLGMLLGYQPDEAQGTRELNAQGSVDAYHGGSFEPFREIGDPVAKDEIAGMADHPDTPWQDPDPVSSPYEGMVLCKRALGRVERGDAVFQIAADAVPR